MTTETESVELVWGLQTLHWSGVAQSDCRLFCHVSKFVFAVLDEAAAFLCVAALHADGHQWQMLLLGNKLFHFYRWPVMLIPIDVCATFAALHARITEPCHTVVGVVLRFGLTLLTRVGRIPRRPVELKVVKVWRPLYWPKPHQRYINLQCDFERAKNVTEMETGGSWSMDTSSSERWCQPPPFWWIACLTAWLSLTFSNEFVYNW